MLDYHFIQAEPGWTMVDHIANDVEVPVIGWKMHPRDDEQSHPVVVWPNGPGGPSFNSLEEGPNYSVYHPTYQPKPTTEVPPA